MTWVELMENNKGNTIQLDGKAMGLNYQKNMTSKANGFKLMAIKKCGLYFIMELLAKKSFLLMIFQILFDFLVNSDFGS